MKFYASGNVHYVYMTSLILRIRSIQIFFFIAKRHSSISFINDKSVTTCTDVTRLLLMFENLTLTLAKKRCEWIAIKRLFLKQNMFFPFVKTSGYHLKVFVFRSNQIQICQTKIVENHFRRYNVTINSMSESESWQIMVHYARG